jgi:hypothetical protein
VTGWPVLDVAIGLSFMFFVLSIVCSSLNEGIATVLNWRAKTLELWIGNVLSDPTQLQRIAPAIKDNLARANVPENAQAAVAGTVAAAVADTSITIAQIKAKIADALKAVNVSEADAEDAVTDIFHAAEEARKAPASAVPAQTGTTPSARADEFFSHPAVQPLIKPPTQGPAIDPASGRPRGRRPSYVPSSTFATVLLNQATGGHATDATAGQVIANLPAVIGAAVTDIGHAASNAAADGTADLLVLREKIERYYDTSMQRVAGWYKRKVQLALTIIALVVSVGLNADSLGVTSSLWSDTTVRNVIVANAGRAVTNQSSSASSQGLTPALDQAKQLNLPLGWGHRGSGPAAAPHDFGSWVSKVAGILLTTFALTLGAPFWFDVLGRLFQVKGTGPKPASTAGTASPAGTASTAGTTIPASRPAKAAANA